MKRLQEGFKGARLLVLPDSIIQDMEKDNVLSILHITDIGYYPKAQYHFIERKKAISQFIFIYCIEGAGWFEINGQKSIVKENNFFVIPAFTPHSYGADEQNPWTIYWVHFKGRLAREYSPQVGIPIEINPNTRSRISERLDLFEEIFHLLGMGYSLENLHYACSAFQYFLSTFRNLQQYRNTVKNNMVESDIVEAAINFMKENIEKPLSLEEIAKYIGYSTTHFYTIFHRRTGYSPCNYCNQLKIQKACQLLDFSDIKINQLCFKVGISDSYYFSRLFHKIMGISPSEYKKRKKG
ncbi:MAG: AraC family transcriptional regulator [Bacteroidota bacterium]|nr:AraC family transcriptional regulator [Bacteroidota bacterium]MDP4274890.1 AraC family transcriptional regulator [Bacteroidota bacterium]